MMKKKKIFKIVLWMGISAVILSAAAVSMGMYCIYAVEECGKYCFSRISELPEYETALLPGAAEKTPNGTPNLYFSGRVECAAKLFHAGKIKHILISGDNSRPDYNEPEDMKNALLGRGVPEEAMTLDYAGFRTLDSVVRAKNVFRKNKFLIITQPFHAERAVYIARRHEIDAAAFYAPEPTHLPWLIERNHRREKFACIAAWLDVNIWHRSPEFEK